MRDGGPSLLITGGTGFLGRHLAAHFVKHGLVAVLTRRSADEARKVLLDPRIKIVKYDSTDLRTVFSEYNFTAVIHSAVAYGRSESAEEVHAVNVALPMELASLASSHGGASFIHIDTFFRKLSEEYPYLQEYRRSKKIVREKLAAFQGRSTIVNAVLEHLYGPDEAADKFLPALIRDLKSEKSSLDLTPGEQRRDFIHVDDVTLAIDMIVRNIPSLPHFSEFEVGTGESTSIREMVELLKELTGSRAELRFGAMPYREHELMDSKADTKALLKLGWRPQVALSKGLSRIVGQKSH